MLAHDSRQGREYHWLFSVPAMMEIQRAELDLFAGAVLFAKAESVAREFPDHPAWRETLIVEAHRRLLCRRPLEARRLLEEAAAIPDNRMQNEDRRLRLWVSALLDCGQSAGKNFESAAGVLPDSEKRLLDVERTLARGELPADLQLPAGGALERVSRLCEWFVRFPQVFESRMAQPIVEQALAAASQLALPAAIRFFSSRKALLDRPEAFGPVSIPPALTPGWVCEDPVTRKAFELARRVAPSIMSVLLLGETGTGKEILARELHRMSGRPGPFVALNVASLTETLLESELFGHARGAFTGADRDRAGLVEMADGGTLFLDEIAELPLLLQAKLLRVLQEREFRRLGETGVRTANFRLVSATHQDVDALTRERRFRQDLFFRIAGIVIDLPPLRSRPKDLRKLMESILPSPWNLTPQAEGALESYSWPGNVRELLAALEAARLLASPGTTIDLTHLPAKVRGGGKAGAAIATPSPRRYFAAIEETKRREIVSALAEARGNRTGAARLLGLTRQALLYEMKKLGVTK